MVYKNVCKHAIQPAIAGLILKKFIILTPIFLTK